ncbi:MAG: tryptophan synthase subunit beta [Epsilonproteobacteria bacterium]|nr:tryptophan synthase subunit beta [Campylobacterota bacterium]
MLPNSKGYYGGFGGKFVPEVLMGLLDELEKSYNKIKKERWFADQFKQILSDYVGRPTPLYEAKRLSRKYGFRIFLKREDLAHTGAHKINNTVGQAILAKAMGKTDIIAETGAGQHGVAAATACAMLGLKCKVFMGEEDIKRQHPNVERMRILGAEVIPVSSGTRTLKDAINEAIRYWVSHADKTFYLIGSAVGPHPYPSIVRDFQSVIGTEAKRQIKRQTGRLPDIIIACVGGGSNSIGIFWPFLKDNVKFVGVEAGGIGVGINQNAATLTYGRPGILHGALSYLLFDKNGNICPTHSIAAGLDYPGVGPAHSFFKETGRAEYHSVSDKEALDAFYELSKLEGIIPAMESSHAIAYLNKLKGILSSEAVVIVNLSGRGDKDLDAVLGKTK